MSAPLLDEPIGVVTTGGTREHDDAVTARRIVMWSLALFVVLRLDVVLTATTPAVTPDEFGAWAIARYLSGQDTLISMRDMPRYPLVAGAVLTPIEALGLHPVVAYRAALALLSVVVVAAAELVRRAVRVLVPAAPLLATAAFALTLCFPATFVTSTMTWAEPTVLLWWALLLWGVARFAHEPTTAAILVTSVAAGLAPFVHGRLIAVPVVWMLAIVVRTVHDHRDPATKIAPALLAGVPLTLGVAVAARALDSLVTRAVWTSAYSPASEGLADAAGTGPWWRGLGTALVGQSWYVLAATAGLALFGAAFLVTSARRPAARGSRLFAVTLGAMLASNLGVSVVSAAVGLSVLYGGSVEGVVSGTRWDHAVYGRYVDSAVLVLALLGVVMLWQNARRPVPGRLLGAAAAATVVAGLGVALLLRGRDLGDALDITIAGVSSISRSGEGVQLAQWTAWAVLTLLAVGAGLRRGRRGLLLVLAVWSAVGLAGGTGLALERHRVHHQPDWTVVGAPGQSGDELIVATDSERDPYMRLGVFGLQRDLASIGWRTRFDAGDSATLAAQWQRRTPAPDALVLLEGHEPAGEGWTAAMFFEDGNSVVWRR